ncbi:hypothetical protein E2C01_013510 [Portunus trituberculatus]|uniref:Uncharacterized protein n=1 Tax=Portunus trituberculatus TaxID=210409 RepID=A0A5B7DGG3_PORTR|nr:hypothetical protein [Portunus trituberculatus]
MVAVRGKRVLSVLASNSSFTKQASKQTSISPAQDWCYSFFSKAKECVRWLRSVIRGSQGFEASARWRGSDGRECTKGQRDSGTQRHEGHDRTEEGAAPPHGPH